MRDIKLDRVVKGLNKWLKHHNFNIDVNLYTEGPGYMIKLYSANSTRLISTTVVELHHFDSQYEDFLRELIFKTLRDDFEKAIDARPVITSMHDLRTQEDIEEYSNTIHTKNDEYLNTLGL